MSVDDYSNANDKTTTMNTLSACINKVVKNGYTDSFKVSAQGLAGAAEDKYYRPEEVKIIDFYRFEGESDPGDQSILYVIETNDGKKGTLINAYGAYADTNVDNYMREVMDINKNVDKADKSQA